MLASQATAHPTGEPSAKLNADAATAAGVWGHTHYHPCSLCSNPYTHMSLDELLAVHVTSVTGLDQTWFGTPAAMYVIDPYDIQRIGARSIPEALRIVPGLHVARIDARRYAITSRGFNGIFSNKLQVLVDGRSVYEPSFAGVYWDQQDTIMEDLEKIEVIRGPGAMLWGANAVNGVINIDTKSARDTQGTLLSGGAGTEERYFGQARYGDQINDDTWFRVWTKYNNRDESYDPATGGGETDHWDAAYGGFRLDHNGADNARFTLIGGFTATSDMHLTMTEPIPDTHFGTSGEEYIGEIYSGHILALVDRDLQSDNGWRLQGYFDTNHRAEFGNRETRQTVDMDFKYHLKPGETHDLLCGLGWRFSHLHMGSPDYMTLDPVENDLHLFTAFAQDTITLVPDHWFALIGTKVEHNDFTGFEAQPSARLWWTPCEHQTLWASISRAVRTPSVVERDITITRAFADTGLLGGGPPSGSYLPIQVLGNKHLESEELVAFELGYRHEFDEVLTLDFAGFINRYNNLVCFRSTSPTTSEYVNDGSAESYGVELAARWKVDDNWSIDGSYSYLNMSVHNSSSASDERDSPQHQFNIRTHYALNDQWQFDAALYFSGERSGPGATIYTPTAAYTRLDLGLTWKPTHDLEISVWGQNLLDAHHAEYVDPFISGRPTEIQRGVYVQVTYRF